MKNKPHYVVVYRRKSVGEVLKKIRMQTVGLSLRDLEALSGVSLAALSKLENGENFTMDTFLSICFALEIYPWEVLDPDSIINAGKEAA